MDTDGLKQADTDMDTGRQRGTRRGNVIGAETERNRRRQTETETDRDRPTQRRHRAR